MKRRIKMPGALFKPYEDKIMPVENETSQALRLLSLHLNRSCNVGSDLLQGMLIALMAVMFSQRSWRFIFDNQPIIDRIGLAIDQRIFLAQGNGEANLVGKIFDEAIDPSSKLGFIV